MKKLGIIGGLGPMATAYFLERVTQMCDAKKDQEHIQIVLISNPAIPDRTKFLLGESNNSPLPLIIKSAEQLRTMGAEVIAIPCITAHCYYEQLVEACTLPIINPIRSVCKYLKVRNYRKIGIMCTDGTRKSKLFQKVFQGEELECIFPDEDSQKQVMNIIYKQIKAGNPVDVNGFMIIGKKLRECGAQILLLACTELSLIKKDYQLGPGYLDMLDILALDAVSECNRVKREFMELVTK